MKLPSIFLFFAALIASVTALQVTKDIGIIGDTAERIDNALESFGSTSTYSTGFRIVQDGYTLVTTYVTAANDAKNLNCPLSDADGLEVLNAIKKLQPHVKRGFDILVAKKDVIASIGGPIGSKGLVFLTAQVIAKLNPIALKLFADLLACAPVSLKDEWTAVTADITVSFNAGATAYPA